jgi:arylsulfatase A-like enzyme
MAIKSGVLCVVFSALIGTALPISALTNKSQEQAKTDSKTNRYNVLFIAVDDLRPELGCYGVKDAQSPNIDAFAKTAMSFRRHYAAVATCGASRYALLTGRSPALTGVTQSNEAMYQGGSAFKQASLPGAQTMPELFRRSGYETVCIGKISHTPDGRVFGYDGSGDGRAELPNAWERLSTPFGEWQRGWGVFFGYPGGRHREDGKGNNAILDFTSTRDDELPDAHLARAGMDEIDRLKKASKPWFMGVGFYKPHLPFTGTKSDWDAIKTTRVLSDVSGAKPSGPYWHESGEFYKYQMPWEKTCPLSAAATVDARRAYLASIRYVDRQIGKVLGALKASGQDKNTIVVLWGDHGWHLGEQQIWGKHSVYERAMNSTLMVRIPGMQPAGKFSDALISSTDIYPTLLELCQPAFQNVSAPLDGHSFVKVLDGSQTRHNDAVLSYWGNAIGMRNATHRLLARRDGKGGFTDIELHDMRTDIDSTANVATTNPALVAEMVAKLPKRRVAPKSP